MGITSLFVRRKCTMEIRGYEVRLRRPGKANQGGGYARLRLIKATRLRINITSH